MIPSLLARGVGSSAIPGHSSGQFHSRASPDYSTCRIISSPDNSQYRNVDLDRRWPCTCCRKRSEDPMITNDVFVSFLHCNRKAFLRAAGTPGHPTDFETVLLDLGQTYRRKALEAFLAPYPAQDVLHDPLRLEEALKNPTQIIVNATASAGGLSSLI